MSISIAGDRGDLDTDASRDEDVEFEVFVANFGPGTARNTHVVVSLPKEFDENSLAGDLAECDESNGSEEGSVVCNLGDLPPGDKRQLEFNIELEDERGGDSRDRTTTVVSLLTDSLDPELDNNTASRDLDIRER